MAKPAEMGQVGPSADPGHVSRFIDSGYYFLPRRFLSLGLSQPRTEHRCTLRLLIGDSKTDVSIGHSRQRCRKNTGGRIGHKRKPMSDAGHS
jgi:hypothetical protein